MWELIARDTYRTTLGGITVTIVQHYGCEWTASDADGFETKGNYAAPFRDRYRPEKERGNALTLAINGHRQAKDAAKQQPALL